MEATVKRSKNGRDSRGRFAKGNPGGGRPRNTQEQKDALQQIRDLAPTVSEEMRRILTDPEESSALKVRIAEIVLDRAYGKPKQELDATLNRGDDFVLEIVGGDSGADSSP